MTLATRTMEAIQSGAGAPRAVLVAACCGGFVFQADLTAVSAILSEIVADVPSHGVAATWLMDAYSLAMISMLPAAGSIADRFGRRRLFSLGALFFGVASVGCALSPTFAILIACRVGQGVSGALLTTAGTGLLSQLYEGQERRNAFAAVGTSIGAAVLVGPPVALFLAQTVGWRWLLWINAPICLAIVILARRAAESHDQGAAGKRIDWRGCATLASSAALLCFVLLESRSSGLDLFRIVMLSVCAAGLFGLFVFIEGRSAYPAIELGLFRSRAFLGASLAPAALSVGYWSLLVYVPLVARGRMHLDTTGVGWLLTCLTVPMLVLPRIGAGLAARLSSRVFFAAGLIVVGLADVLLSVSVATDVSLVFIVLALSLAGAGAALINPQISAAAIAVVPGDRAAMAVAISVIMRQFGFAVGIALLGCLANSGSFALAFAGAAAIALVGSATCFWLLSIKSPEPAWRSSTSIGALSVAEQINCLAISGVPPTLPGMAAEV
jgi:MFS family permease